MSTAPESRFRWLVEHAIAVSAIRSFFRFREISPFRVRTGREQSCCGGDIIHCLDQKFLDLHHAGCGQVIPHNR
jgi:hypothetical protein